MMQYIPVTSVWEITMNCNMRCKHCGSSCEGPLPDELTTEEALKMCDDLAKLGLRKITLSGGEPLSRPDWDKIVARFTENKVVCNVLSNGWLIDDEVIEKGKAAGLANFGMSCDGLEKTHDYIRKEGSFARIMGALDRLKENGVPSAIVTCISTQNIDQLPEMRELLIKKGVSDWQLQAALPMGNLLEHPEWILKPEDVDRIIDFAYDTMKDGRIRAHLANDVGYFNMKEVELKKTSFESEYNLGIWNGCPAGKENIGVRCNGDIIGCLSIRDDSYLEGNVRDTPLEELWNREGAFAWNRDMKKAKLTGFCKICQYGAYCCAGCGGPKIMIHGTIYENKFCSYYAAVDKERQEINKIDSFEELANRSNEEIKGANHQLAEICISRALEMKPDTIDLMNNLGYVHFQLENYPECEDINHKVIALDPKNAYAHKGLGLAYSKNNKVEEGIATLKKSIELSDENFLDPYHDLAIVYCENDRVDEALDILEKGRAQSADFTKNTEEFKKQLLEGKEKAKEAAKEA
ncbi:MAG: radical SAM protein [bacterium]|nr:radical SAM protein [bacterium]